jgi:hypothetical protein
MSNQHIDPVFGLNSCRFHFIINWIVFSTQLEIIGIPSFVAMQTQSIRIAYKSYKHLRKKATNMFIQVLLCTDFSKLERARSY